MRDEWREEAKEFYAQEGYGTFLDGHPCKGGYEIDNVEVILDLMVEFAIKKQSERGM